MPADCRFCSAPSHTPWRRGCYAGRATGRCSRPTKKPLLRPGTGDIGAQGMQATDEAEVAIALEFQSCRKGEVTATALAGNDDMGWVDIQFARPIDQPLHPGHAIVKPRRKQRHFRCRRRCEAVAKIHHRHGDPWAAIILPQARYMPTSSSCSAYRRRGCNTHRARYPMRLAG